MFNLNDNVRVIDEDGKTVKEGVIVAMTNVGARVCSTKNEFPFTDIPAHAEWFAFRSKSISIVPIRKKKN